MNYIERTSEKPREGLGIMAVLTKHGEKRIAERIGASQSSALKNANKAFKYGIRHKETLGGLHDWMSGKFLLHKSASNMRIYRGYMYVFSKDVLITVYPIPDIYASIEDYVDPEAYDRYVAHFKKKDTNQDKKYQELRNEFDRKVVLNDVRDYVKNRYSVEISGVGLEQYRIRIFYVPTDYEIPDLTGLVDYVKRHTGYRSVRLMHKTDVRGNRVYHRKYNYDPDECELVYRAD